MWGSWVLVSRLSFLLVDDRIHFVRWKLGVFVEGLWLCGLGRRHHRGSWDGYVAVSLSAILSGLVVGILFLNPWLLLCLFFLVICGLRLRRVRCCRSSAGLVVEEIGSHGLESEYQTSALRLNDQWCSGSCCRSSGTRAESVSGRVST